ncbi:hypothetical protein M3J09_006984 [Ascochyta lentis]
MHGACKVPGFDLVDVKNCLQRQTTQCTRILARQRQSRTKRSRQAQGNDPHA